MPVVVAEQVSKRFLLRHAHGVELKVRFLDRLHGRQRGSIEEFWALRDVSLSIERGEAVGLLGRNGSGKSTLLKLIAAIHQPTTGRVLVTRGARICSMIELGIGFHPELTGRENIFLNAAIHGLSRDEIESIYEGIVDYSELGAFMDVPIKTYSSGMHMRLGFSIAAHLDPSVLLLDEIFAVGDASFQQRCLKTLRGFVDEGRTIVLVSHAPEAIRTMCRRACVLDRGALAFDGEVEAGLSFYERMLTGRFDAPADATTHADGDSPSGSDRNSSADARARWVAEVLAEIGVPPGHRTLDLTGGELTLEHAAPHADYDAAIAYFPALSFTEFMRAVAGALPRLAPRGRVYAVWFENPEPANVEPVVHGSGLTTFADHAPYHYAWALIACTCEALGARVERVRDRSGPHGESLLAISRFPATTATG
jgi:ABC-2 type transport system ATP-binding protein